MINSGKNWKKKEERRDSTPLMLKKWYNWGVNIIIVCIVGYVYSKYFTFKQKIAMD